MAVIAPSLNNINEIFNEDLDAVFFREQTLFDQQAGPFGHRLILFGAGGLGKRTLAGLRTVGIEPLAFTDNNKDLWGKKIEGLIVYPPEEAARIFGQQALFVVTIWHINAKDRMASRISQMENLGCQAVCNFGPLYWKYHKVFLPYFMIDLPSNLFKHKDDVIRAYHLWKDEGSLRQYTAEILFRFRMEFDHFFEVSPNSNSFPEDLWTYSPEDIFIECGAFNGDSILNFLRINNNFKEIIAFEPDSSNFAILETNISFLPQQIKEKISCFPYAVGNNNEKLRFNALGSVLSSLGEGNQYVECVRLDDIIINKKPTLIKMDIEGAEIDALTGASGLISGSLPNICISAYHKQDHIWRVPLKIHSLSNRYDLYLRPQELEGWDLVCYAAKNI